MTSPVRAPRPTPRRAPQPAPAPRRPHLRVVPPPARPSLRPSLRPAARRRRTGAVLCVAMIIVFGSLMASAMFHGLLVSGQSDIDRMNAQITEERTALAQEKLELADLQSPARIAEEARKRGMVPADQQHWVTPGSTDDPIVTGKAPVEDDADGSTTDDSTGTSSTGSPDELATADGGGTAQ